jgi:hypothetical protein
VCALPGEHLGDHHTAAPAGSGVNPGQALLGLSLAVSPTLGAYVAEADVAWLVIAWLWLWLIAHLALSGDRP